MKRLTSILLVMLMLVSVFSSLSISANAGEITATALSSSSEDFKYVVLSDNTAKITGYTGDETELEIPREIDSYVVKSIGDWAFLRRENLTSITIPNGITSIGDLAFSGCKGLTSVILTGGMKFIGYRAFYDCKSLTSITIPSSVTSIGDDAFLLCESLENAYYSGNQQQWNGIDFGVYNECLANTTIHYNYAIPCINHEYRSAVTKKATCKAEGIKTFTCIYCGDTKTEKINQTAHNKVITSKGATYFTNGYKDKITCKDCGKVFSKGAIVNKLKLKVPKVTIKGGKRKLVVKYTKVSGATGFQLRYKRGSKIVVKNYNTKIDKSKTIKNLKKGAYKVQIRAFVKSGKKTAYSSWIIAKRVKVKG